MAISASSMRGARGTGVVKSGRLFLCTLPLDAFGTGDAAAFRRALDTTTRALVQALPPQGRFWGLARKGLNLFLRDCLYTVYLRDAFALQLAEAFFEVPLDSISGKALYDKAEGRLPRWKTVRGMTPALSDQYQAEAVRLATVERVPRVHLDAVWWGERADKGSGTVSP
jgi:hypothetical protein